MQRLLTTREAAKYLNLSESTLRQGRIAKARPGGCPKPVYVRIGRKVLYRVEDLDRFLEQHSVDPQAREGGK